MTQDLIFK